MRSLVIGVALMVAVSVSVAGEKALAKQALPVAVRAAVEKATAGGTVKRIVLETEDGRDEYSVDADVAGKHKEFTFGGDGTLLAEEVDVAYAELPSAVRAAAERYFGRSDGLSASKEVSDGVTSFEVEGRKNGMEMSVTFNPEGALLEEEKDSD